MDGRGRVWIGAALSLGCAAAVAGSACAQQSLDDAVAEQLADFCLELYGPDGNIDDLEGNLRGFCVGGGATPPVSAASGGGAATPASSPGVLQQQQREHLLASAESGGTTAASGDAAHLDLDGRLSLFAFASRADVDKTRSPFEDGYDADVRRATLGASYRIGTGVVAGLAFDHVDDEGNYDGGGDFEIKSHGMTAFAAASGEHLTVQASGGYARQDHQRTRPVAVRRGQDGLPERLGEASGDYDGRAYFLEVAAIPVWQWRRLTLTPWASLTWARVDYDGYAEEGDTGLELRFEDDHQTSLISTLGLGAATLFSVGPVALIPAVGVSWLHEFERDQRTVEVSFVGDTRAKPFTYDTEKPERNYGLATAGLTAVLPNGLRPFVQLQSMFANSRYDARTATIGLSFDF